MDFDTALRNLDEAACLESYAALEAAKVLTQNWRDALRDGTTLERLLPDVDRTIERLRSFKKEVAALAA